MSQSQIRVDRSRDVHEFDVYPYWEKLLALDPVRFKEQFGSLHDYGPKKKRSRLYVRASWSGVNYHNTWMFWGPLAAELGVTGLDFQHRKVGLLEIIMQATCERLETLMRLETHRSF
jgi:hypothetical protein